MLRSKKRKEDAKTKSKRASMREKLEREEGQKIVQKFKNASERKEGRTRRSRD